MKAMMIINNTRQGSARMSNLKLAGYFLVEAEAVGFGCPASRPASSAGVQPGVTWGVTPQATPQVARSRPRSDPRNSQTSPSSSGDYPRNRPRNLVRRVSSPMRPPMTPPMMPPELCGVALTGSPTQATQSTDPVAQPLLRLLAGKPPAVMMVLYQGSELSRFAASVRGGTMMRGRGSHRTVIPGRHTCCEPQNGRKRILPSGKEMAGSLAKIVGEPPNMTDEGLLISMKPR